LANDQALWLDGLRLKQGDFALNASLRVAQGGLTAIIGPSGAGKSTLLAAIAGFLAPAAGRILWQGAEITGLPPGKRPVSVLFQDNNLFPHLTIEQNLGLAIDPRLRLRDADRARIAQMLDRIGIGGLGARKPAALSGGQQSRAALGRVLLADRPLVLLDEPFAALGPGLRQEMLAMASEALRQAGRTTLLVTHDPGDATDAAEETIFVDDGIAYAPAPTAELMRAPPPALARYLGAL